METLSRNAVFEIYVKDEIPNLVYPILIAGFVSSLKGQYEQMARILSVWRENGVYDYIRSHVDWTEIQVDVKQITLGQMPAAAELLRRNDHRLDRVANDAELPLCPEFNNLDRPTPTRTRFISQKADNDYLLVDGTHRAVRMASEGVTSFSLLVPAPRLIKSFRHSWRVS